MKGTTAWLTHEWNVKDTGHCLACPQPHTGDKTNDLSFGHNWLDGGWMPNQASTTDQSFKQSVMGNLYLRRLKTAFGDNVQQIHVKGQQMAGDGGSKIKRRKFKYKSVFWPPRNKELYFYAWSFPVPTKPSKITFPVFCMNHPWFELLAMVAFCKKDNHWE